MDVKTGFGNGDVRMAGGLDEEEATMYSCVLNVSLSLGGEFFP